MDKIEISNEYVRAVFDPDWGGYFSALQFNHPNLGWVDIFMNEIELTKSSRNTPFLVVLIWFFLPTECGMALLLGLMLGFNFRSIFLKMDWRSMGLALPITGALLNTPMHLLR